MDDDATLQKEFSQEEVFLVVIGSERVCPMVTGGVTVVTSRVTVVTEQGMVWSELLQKGNFISHLLYLILRQILGLIGRQLIYNCVNNQL